MSGSPQLSLCDRGRRTAAVVIAASLLVAACARGTAPGGTAGSGGGPAVTPTSDLAAAVGPAAVASDTLALATPLATLRTAAAATSRGDTRRGPVATASPADSSRAGGPLASPTGASRGRGPSAPPAASAALGAAARGRGAPAPADPPIGVQILEAEVETDAIVQLRAAGATWARVRALWKLIEPQRRDPPVYDWSVTDWLFGDTTAAGFVNVAAVYANPPWAGPTECGPVAREHLDRYAALWTALVERYDGDGRDDSPTSGVVRYWQVSNEPDFDPTTAGGESDYGGCFGDHPEVYADQLVIAWRAAHAADPDTHVGLGPVAWDRFTEASAPEGWTAPYGPYRYDFTQWVLARLSSAHGADPQWPYFDFVGLHVYNDYAHYWDWPGWFPEGPRAGALDDLAVHHRGPGIEDPVTGIQGGELQAKVAAFRTEQLAAPDGPAAGAGPDSGDGEATGSPLTGVVPAGDGSDSPRPRSSRIVDMPLMISETGMASGPSDEWTMRDEATQATYVGQTLVRGVATGAIATIWYTARDNIMGDCEAPHWDWLAFGLMRSDAYQSALEQRCPGQDWVRGYDLSRGPATPKPALTAYAVAAEALEGRRLVTGTIHMQDSGMETEVFEFDGDRGPLVVAWALNSERLGRRMFPGQEGLPQQARDLAIVAFGEVAVTSEDLEPWTGRVLVTDYMGRRRIEAATVRRDLIAIDVDDRPVYVTVAR